MVASVAFQSNKNSGSNFRKFPVWNGTTFSEISEKEHNFHSTFPFSPNFRAMVCISEIQQFSESQETFPENFEIFALEFSLDWKAPRSFQKLTRTWCKRNFEIQSDISVLSKPYQVGVPPPTRCHKTQLSWSVHLGRLCQRLSWSKPLHHCSSDAYSLHRNPRHLEPAESPGHQRRKNDKCTLS